MATVLEILSNEVLMQFFEHLDAYHLFKGFFNLNSRFNRLLTDHQLHLKFNSKHVRDNDTIDVQIWHIMVNYLTAVTLMNDKHIQMFISISQESNLTHLQSLTLRQVRIRKDKASVVKCISKLKSLKNLRVQSKGEIHDLTLMVFCSNQLPELKSFECTNAEYPTTVFFVSPRQRTNIENLTVDCILYNLSNVLLQTPKLKYLNIDLTTYGPAERTKTEFPLPTMMNLTQLKMKIHSISYIQLSDIMKCMPHLESLELSGSSMGKNLDNGQQLKQLFGHLQEVILDNLECLTSATSVDTILTTFNDDFWSDVTCSIKYDRAYLSALGHAK